jgi:hypothetical protein
MTTDQTLVIVGASLAGAKAAEGARTAGFDGRVVLVGDEHELPYAARSGRSIVGASHRTVSRCTSAPQSIGGSR